MAYLVDGLQLFGLWSRASTTTTGTGTGSTSIPTSGTAIVLKWTQFTPRRSDFMDLYDRLCSYENLELAYQKARKRKTLKDYVIEFEADLENNLKQLKRELETFNYAPAVLTTFIVRDPKTRRISASHFRDRVVHHALCNVIEPILSKGFIHDSFANQKNKGTHKAIERFEYFMRKARYGGGR